MEKNKDENTPTFGEEKGMPIEKVTKSKSKTH